MSSATLTTTSTVEQSRTRLIPAYAWVQIVVLTMLFLWFHYDYLWYMIGFAPLAAGQSSSGGIAGSIGAIFDAKPWGYALVDADWSHALAIPFMSLWFVWQQRDRLHEARVGTAWWALPILILGMAGYLLSIMPIRNDMLQGYFMVFNVFALCLFLLGPGMMQWIWFPIFYLVFAVKVSASVWNMVTFKLQEIAAIGATFMLNVIGLFADMRAQLTGTNIHLWIAGEQLENALNVAEACSGIRSLMMFVALGCAVAWLGTRPWWARLIIVGSTIPVALFANMVRVTTLGVLHPINPELARGDSHIFIGMAALLIVALVMFVLIGWVLNRVVIVEPSDAKK